MNKIYRIIWSKAKNCWVVVSEIAKRSGKAVGGKTGTAVDGGAVGMKRMLTARVACSLLLGAVLAVSFGQQAAGAGQVIVKPDDVGKVYFYGKEIGAGYGAGNSSTAWGYKTYSLASYSTAWGSETTSQNIDTTAWGYKSNASGFDATAWGGWNTRGLVEISGGTASGKASTAFGIKTTASGDASTAWGGFWTNNTKDTVRIGGTASGGASTAFGIETTASGTGSTAWGGYSTGSAGSEVATKGGTASGGASTAWGLETTAGGIGSTAWGNSSEASGNYSTAFGSSSAASAVNSLAALGGITDSGATNSAAIGVQAKASLADTVALGSGAVANRAAYNASKNKYTAYLGDTTKTGVEWRANRNAIAVGASANNGDTATVTRQITGVAAGTYDTDAVNVAQL
ncbi:MAG: hypothetical protein IJ181_10625, partial [Acidaminococcaceae bacterium]|nr:hypothetical protein [Acidaminococcaceae bacterium]